MITKEDYDLVKEFYGEFKNAALSRFIRNVQSKDYHKILNIYNKYRNNDHNIYKLNCSVCLLNLFTRMFYLLNDYKPLKEIDLKNDLEIQVIKETSKENLVKETLDNKPLKEIDLKETSKEIKPKVIRKRKTIKRKTSKRTLKK
jgi:hypothetical protein